MKNKGDIEKNDEKVGAEKIDKDNVKVEKDNEKVEVEKTDEKVDSKKDDKVGKDAQNDGENISWSDVPKLDSNNLDMTSEVMGDGNEEVSSKPPTPDFRSEQSDDEKLNSDSDLNETVLMKTGKDENMSISSMGKSGEENDEKMSVSSAGSPHRLSKDSQQTVEYEDPATPKEMSPDRNSSAGLLELADEVCDSVAKMLGRKREKAAGSPGILKKFKIDLNSEIGKIQRTE